jgi:predicted dehydrogenase
MAAEHESDDSRELTAGVVGTGNLAKETSLRLDQLGVEIEAVSDGYSPEEDVAAFAEEFDADAYGRKDGEPDPEAYRNVLADDVDMLFITNAHSGHYEPARESLDADVATFVEKPLTVRPERAEELVRAAEETDVPLGVGFQRRFKPAFKRAREAVRDGRVGDVYRVEGEIDQRWLSEQKGTWRTVPSISGGGNLFDSGTHGIDVALWISGTRPREVVDADLKYVDSDEIDGVKAGIEREARVDAVLDRDGTPVDASFTVRGEMPEQDGGRPYVNEGPAGDGTPVWYERLKVEGSEADLVYWHTVDETPEGYEEESSLALHHDDGIEPLPVEGSVDDMYEKIADFVESVENGSEPAVTGRDGAYVTALVDATYTADIRARRGPEYEPRVDISDFLSDAGQYGQETDPGHAD